MSKSTHTPQYDALRRLLVSMRKDAKLSQRDLAERLERDQNYVYRVEGGDRRLDVLELYWYCQALDQDPYKTIAAIFKDFDRMSTTKIRK